ncbi:putative Arabinan endo-1,5-alpha-L-arabinosidase [Powellomyces hirtus]|nr:putative Arabinan endo-1,5-alpha-L-arabinosidase [Powellomyces hirtus]
MLIQHLCTLAVALMTGPLIAHGAPLGNLTSLAPTAYPLPQPVFGPPGAVNIYDPTMIYSRDGSYLLYGTFVNLTVHRSLDRRNWVIDGPVFPNGTPWCDTYVAADKDKFIWAPDVHYQGGQYVLYYACSTMGSQYSAIFHATSPTGRSGTWTHRGVVVTSQRGDRFNAIDPNLQVDGEGGWWLTFGSFWSGIKQIELDRKTGKPVVANNPVRDIAARHVAPYAIEAPVIHKHGAHYLLFVSFDICCIGAGSTYRVMVGRSDSIHGPFVDRDGVRMLDGGGTQLLFTHGSINGPGGQSVMRDRNGKDLLVYHYFSDDHQRMLGLNHLEYDADGWPYIVPTV